MSLLLLAPLLVLAERSGNFEIVFTPVTTESSATVDRTAWHTEKEKSQSMVYRVRIDLKGIEKLADLKVLYVVAFRAPSNYSSRNVTRYATGEETIAKLAPMEKYEFTTESVENVYREYKWSDGKSSYGKAQLKGICVRIMQGDKKLAESASSAEMKDGFEKAAKQEEDDERERKRRERDW